MNCFLYFISLPPLSLSLSFSLCLSRSSLPLSLFQEVNRYICHTRDCDLVESPILPVETVIFPPVQTKIAVSTGRIDNLTGRDRDPSFYR